MFNYQQFLSALRWVMTTLGVTLANYGLVQGGIWEAVTGVAIAGAPFVWSMIRHTKIGTVIAAEELDGVAGVITKPTAEGVALTQGTPGKPIVTAGTPAAEQIAVTGTKPGGL